MDRLTSLSAFVQAAETRSFTAAGRKLGISSSGVGKTIARLEERLGVRLFHRSTRSITLTVEGEAFLTRCRRVFEELDAAESELARTTGTPSGRLRVSLPLIATLLTPSISAFSKVYPEVQLDLDFSDRMVDIIEEGFDVVIRTGELSDSALKSKLLGGYTYKTVAAPDYLAVAGTPKIPDDLAQHACIRHRWSTTGKLESWRLHDAGREIEAEIPATIVCNTVEPIGDLAERGAGIASLPSFAVVRQLRQGTLVPVLEDYQNESGALRLVWPSSRHLMPKVRAFVDFMAENRPAGLTN
jgi:DNA-binding transcriptional LysR family regulator